VPPVHDVLRHVPPLPSLGRDGPGLLRARSAPPGAPRRWDPRLLDGRGGAARGAGATRGRPFRGARSLVALARRGGRV